jgi:hypothetical protein
MRKIVITLIAATLLSATAAAPAFADRWGGHHDRGIPGGPLWPVVAALSIPAAVIDTVAHIAFPFHGVGYPAIPVTAGPAAYAGPADYAPTAYYAPRAYVAPRVYVAPRGYYAPRGHYAPRGYYEPRGYYRDRGYRTYRGGW